MSTFKLPRTAAGVRAAVLTLVGVVALAGAAFAAPGSSPAVSSPDPITLTGTDWAALSPAERDAFLAGFIAGAAAQQAVADAGRNASGRTVAARASALKRGGRLTFPYRENVYRSHLDDYFFYRNRRPHPLIQVLVDLHAVAGHGR